MQQENEIRVKSDGMLEIPDFHDGGLVGMLFPPGKRVILILKNVKDRVHSYELDGVVMLRADDVRAGSIILDFTVSTGDAVRADEVVRALGDEGSSVAPSQLSRVMSQIKKSGLLFVQLSPSYGCEMACICKGIRAADPWLASISPMLTTPPAKS